MQEQEILTNKERLAQSLEEMTSEEQAAVLQIVQVMIGNRSNRHSITELRGLGKEIWHGVDAQDHVRKERDSWRG